MPADVWKSLRKSIAARPSRYSVCRKGPVRRPPPKQKYWGSHYALAGLTEMEIAARETALGDVVERHGVVGVDGEHRVGAGLAGGVHRRGEVRKQRRIELQRVFGEVEVGDLILPHDIREREVV